MTKLTTKPYLKFNLGDDKTDLHQKKVVFHRFKSPSKKKLKVKAKLCTASLDEIFITGPTAWCI